MLIIAIALRWKLKQHMWFWMTIIFLAALHVPLILLVPWTTRWVPAFVIIPIGMADLYLMLWVLQPSGGSWKGLKPPKGKDHERADVEELISSPVWWPIYIPRPTLP
jgi:hypothetical protein